MYCHCDSLHMALFGWVCWVYLCIIGIYVNLHNYYNVLCFFHVPVTVVYCILLCTWEWVRGGYMQAYSRICACA